MDKKIIYRFLSFGLSVGLGMAMCEARASAQQHGKAPTDADLYCSALATDQAIPKDMYIISGENSIYKNSFQPPDFVYINRGSETGVKIGDQFEVIRPVRDPMPNLWFKWQAQLNRAMGTTYQDIGRLRVAHVQGKTSTAEMTLNCDMMQRGDIVLPFAPRLAPPFHAVKFDPFAAPSGKKTAMIVNTKNFGMLTGRGTTVFINLGSAQGVQVGDYFRVFRYQGNRSEYAYQLDHTAYKVYGFGSTPVAYTWNDLPRQVLGEGIVLRAGPNSSTVMLTDSREEIWAGDYVELE
ncbi:MAG: hypothetical protein ABSA96_06705 [Candidatus Acidiferrales bacterium]|jgi:hypothetical protein